MNISSNCYWLWFGFGCCSLLCVCSQVKMSQISLHLIYKDNTRCENAKGVFALHHQWKELWVMKNITACLCGWLVTQDIVKPLRWSMLCGTPHRHIILWTSKRMTGKHQQGNLLCKRTAHTIHGTLMASVLKGLKLQRETRRLILSCLVYCKHTGRKHRSQTILSAPWKLFMVLADNR